MINAPQHSEAGRWLRGMSRSSWRALYRLLRISARESAKATEDAFIYGTGCARIDATLGVQHVPYRLMFRP